VVIIESNVGAKGEWTLASHPSFEVASAPDDSSEPLYRVVGLASLGDHMVVANGGTNQIFFYDSAGNRVRSVGREGGGPGEFERLSAIFVVPGDSLLTFDTRLGRFQIFDPEGRFVRSFSLSGSQGGEGLTGGMPLGVGAERTLVIRTLRFPGQEHARSRVSRATMNVLAYTLTGEFRDSLVSAPGWEAFNSSSGRLGNMPIPFGHSSSLSTWRDGVIVGSSQTNEIRFYAFDGRLKRIIRNVAPPGPRVEPQEVSAIIARAADHAPPGMSAEMSAEFRALYDEMPIPDRKAPFNWIYSGRDGSLWVLTSQGDESTRRMLIFDERDGRSAWLSIPREFQPFEVRHESVLGVWKDELGLETIREYRIESRAAKP
jgi:hypothetical protein